MTDIYSALDIVCNDGKYGNGKRMDGVCAELARIGADAREREDAEWKFADRWHYAKTPEERKALFLDVLARKIAVNGDETGYSLVEKAASDVLRCAEERKRHNWALKSFDYSSGMELAVDYSREAKEWNLAARRLSESIQAVAQGLPVKRIDELGAIRDLLDGRSVADDRFELHAEAWMKRGRVYVNVVEKEGDEEAELFIENGELHWSSALKEKTDLDIVENAVREILGSRSVGSPLLDVERDGCHLVVERDPNPVCPTLKENTIGDFLFFHGFRKYGVSHGAEPSGSYESDRAALGCRLGDILVPIVAAYDHLEAVDTREYTAEQLNELAPEGYCRVRQETAAETFGGWTPDQVMGAAVSYANGMAYALSAYIGERVFRMALTYGTGTTELAPDPVYAPPPSHHSFRGYPENWLSIAVSDEFGEDVAELFSEDIAGVERLFADGVPEREEEEPAPSI